MPKNNLFRFLKPDVKLSSNGFDLGHRDVFSIKAGALNVAMYLPCVQDDYHEIRPTSYISTMPFNVANFTRMKQHLDFFFVPYTAIQSRFYEFYQQTFDPSNAFFQDNEVASDDFIPHIRLKNLIYCLCYCSAFEHSAAVNTLVHDYQLSENFFGLTFLESVSLRDTELSGPLSIFFDSTHNTLVKDKQGYPVYLNTVRLLDMLGYGNYLSVIKLPIFTGNVQAFIAGATLADAQLIDNAALGLAQDFETVFLPSIDVDISLYNLAAYQCVCQNYFINTYYERPDVKSYNFDDIIINDSDICDVRSGDSSENGLTQLFSINYRPWKKDMFLSALPSPQFGDVSVVSVLTDRFKMSNGSSPSGSAYVGSNSQGNLYRTGNTPENLITLLGSASVIDIRRAEALQYWREQVGRAGFRYDDRYKATFGSSPGFDPKVMPVPIGSVVADVTKDPVTGTSGDDFGEKRATGSSLLQNEVIKFKCPAFGVIIGLISILPESDYDAFMIDKNNRKFQPFDFFTPALQNLGLVPLNIRELSVFTDQAYTGNDYVAGYLPSYYEHKTAVDKLHGEFSDMPAFFKRDVPYGVSPVGQFVSYATSRFDLSSFPTSVRRYYVDPAVLDNIFLVDANADQSTDQFHVSCYFDIKSYRPMSVLGLPNFS